MATSANRSRIFPARSKKSYRLEMEGRTLYLLLTLMALTGVVVFYLGVVTGKAIRDPNATVSLSAEMRAPDARQGAADLQSTLALNNALKSKDSLLEGLQVEEAGITERTRSLLDKGLKQLELREVTPGEKPSATKAPNAPLPLLSSPAARKLPGQPSANTLPGNTRLGPARAATPAMSGNNTAGADKGGTYTVQVFSSKVEKNARELVKRLKNRGFSAYLNRFQSADNQVWYRVRVGRTNRAGADTLSGRLKSEANMKDSQVRKL
jgi:cell division septation protein DedD